CMQALEFSWTF
nr:immunoglobulin light chain junction region [Macaca mulatta]MOY02117.1 immunoglobulin light chain junction region [Macaca mulatta]MOY04726.1 immunoglobulin light chain junction region [Macaca mulatta]MOY10473.1 immunoglobulin light chain junction region [Macaca mulatta]MOY10652.1 immunoglobulin light chain junction region [Macaca mulatta]